MSLFVRLFVNTFYVARVKRFFDIRISNKNIIETYIKEFYPLPLVWVKIWMQ